MPLYVWVRWAAQAMVGKILVVDGVATNRIAFKVALEDAFYQPLIARDGASCVPLALENLPDLILLDLTLPDMSGITVIEKLRRNPATRDIPILALTTDQDVALRRKALFAGADDVLPKHGPLQTLLARVRNLLRGRDGLEGLGLHGASLEMIGFAEAPSAFSGPAVISILSGRTEAAATRHKSIAQVMTDRVILQSREEALVEPNMNPGQPTPDVFVLDAGCARMTDSLRLMSELRSRAATRHAAICIITTNSTDDAATMAYDLGADDLVGACISADELALRLRALIRRKRREDQLRANVQDGLRMALIDPLTGLHNRRYAYAQLAAIADRAHAADSQYAVMVIDLDRFKSVNDRLGHASGDAVLIEVARSLQSNLRTGDLLARIGGEEFLVALPDTSFDEACSAADRLCHAINERQIKVGNAAVLSVTVSIGLAVSAGRHSPEDITALIDRADHALLQAKAEGRNKVITSQTAA